MTFVMFATWVLVGAQYREETVPVPVSIGGK